MRCIDVYTQLYHNDPETVGFCPYRISPLGAHIDYQFGKINGLAIDKGIHFAYKTKYSGLLAMMESSWITLRRQACIIELEENTGG